MKGVFADPYARRMVLQLVGRGVGWFYNNRYFISGAPALHRSTSLTGVPAAVSDLFPIQGTGLRGAYSYTRADGGLRRAPAGRHHQLHPTPHVSKTGEQHMLPTEGISGTPNTETETDFPFLSFTACRDRGCGSPMTMKCRDISVSA